MTDSTFDRDDIHRVYRWEWIIVTAIRAVDHPHMDTDQLIAVADQYLAIHYAGRVSSDHSNLQVLGSGPRTLVYVRLRKPNLKAEWKTREAAERYVQEQGWDDAIIVARNSREDYEVRAYGVRQLPDPKK